MPSALVSWSHLSRRLSQPVCHLLSQQLETCTKFRTECTSCKKLWTHTVCPSTKMCFSVAHRGSASSATDLCAIVGTIASQAAVELSAFSRLTTASLQLMECVLSKASPMALVATFTKTIARTWRLCHLFHPSSTRMALERSPQLTKRNRMPFGVE